MGDLDHVVIILFNQKYMDYSHSKCSSYAHVLTNKSKMYVMNCTQYTVRLTYRTIILIQNFNKTSFAILKLKTSKKNTHYFICIYGIYKALF